MACHLDGSKPLSEPMLEYWWLDPREQNFNQNPNIFIEENTFENVVCEMSISSRPQCVKNQHHEVIEQDGLPYDADRLKKLDVMGI